MKKERSLTYLTKDKQKKAVRAQHPHIFMMLMALAMMILSPIRVNGEIVSTVYDFYGQTNGNNAQLPINYSTDRTCTYNRITCNYFSQIQGIDNPGRFAAQGANNFQLFRHGLYNSNSGGRYFVIDNLYAGDVVIFDGLVGNNVTASVTVVQNANANGNSFTILEKGSLVVSISKTTWIGKITIQHDNSGAWGYDPAIETYDMYNENQNIQSNNLTGAGFPLDVNDYEAQFLTNLTSGLALNNRIAVSQIQYNNSLYTPWQFDHGLKSIGNWHNISICDLKEGDRVVIYYTGSIKFSSKGENMAYNGCPAFKDAENNGDFDPNDDAEIALGMSVEAKGSRWENNLKTTYYTSYPYVITEDGHLDLAVASDARICKIEIYGDHQAQMVDKDNLHDTKTSYFNTTGQLEAKHHIVPGGLHVYIGNDNLAQHAEVVSSDKGPISFVYDQDHYKMARTRTYGNFNVWNDGLPVSGTFYKFVPDVSGKMWVKFKAASINYRSYSIAGNVAYDTNGTPNEVTNNANCPYYLMVEQNGSFQQVENPHYYRNGADGFFGTPNGNPAPGPAEGITVEKGKTYYLYGWWDDTNDAFGWQNGHACGVAELLEVTFRPDNVVTPLAKWVESGTTNDDNLATVRGYNNVVVKKKSDNIASCTATIKDNRLKISNITFVDPNKGGGTILLKIGDPTQDGDPVFVYTIAYNAGYNPQTLGQDASGNDLTRSEGHTWNFSDNPLKGLQWNNRNAEADVVDFGTHFNNFSTATKDENGIPTNGVKSGLLTDEINKGDWTFNYRVKKNGQFHDPRFLNNYDMEGDNADMMWDTEGIIINAGSTQSCIFNEHGTTVDHGLTNKIPNQIADPDRYVGFLKGGQFIIPKLKKDDRVIVYMGSGESSGNEAMEFHITNARDALYNVIDPNDTYHAGGSQWNVPNGHNDPYYRGCYHFYAKEDGDMVFEMSGGSMCKLYSIKIYRGEREETNGIQEAAGKGYTILAEKDQDGNVITSETNTWNLHYRGKGETLADGTGKYNQENEVIAYSGNITNRTIDNPNNTTISYTNIGEIGMLRARVKCMEYNHNYVTDYSDRNFTLALHETQSYPYTWDFTDIDVYSGADIEAENTNYDEPTEPYEEKGYDLSIWDEEGKMNLYGPTWGYVNQNMLFENSKGISGNQLYANDDVIPETKGLWFYFDNNDANYSGSMQIASDGIHLINTGGGMKTDNSGNPVYQTEENSTTLLIDPDNGQYIKQYNLKGWWNYKMVVPGVSSGAAVYLRMTRDARVNEGDFTYDWKDKDDHSKGYVKNYFVQQKFQFGHMAEKIDLDKESSDEVTGTGYKYKMFPTDDGDYIVAIKNTGATSNLTFTLNGWTLKKLGISLDEKKIGTTGYATESRERVIDHRLTSFFTGKPVEAYIGKMNSDHTLMALKQIDIMDSAPNEVANAGNLGKGCILYNAGAADSNTGKTVKVFDDGTFNLFVPDMHLKDESTKNTAGSGTSYTFTTNFAANALKACVPVINSLPEQDNGMTRFILSARPYKKDDNANDWGSSTRPEEEDGKLVGFYHVNPKTGAHMQGHQAYVEIPTNALARIDITFDMFEDIDDGVATKVEGVENAGEGDGSYMTISGQRVERPTKSGIYIKNGKKIVVK